MTGLSHRLRRRLELLRGYLRQPGFRGVLLERRDVAEVVELVDRAVGVERGDVCLWCGDRAAGPGLFYCSQPCILAHDAHFELERITRRVSAAAERMVRHA
jgi:hypothetical protein